MSSLGPSSLRNLAFNRNSGKSNGPSKNALKKQRRHVRKVKAAKREAAAAAAAAKRKAAAILQQQHHECLNARIDMVEAQNAKRYDNYVYDYDSLPPTPNIASLWYNAIMFGYHLVISNFSDESASRRPYGGYECSAPCHIQELLMLAIERNEIECMKALIDRGAKVSRDVLQKLAASVRKRFNKSKKQAEENEQYQRELDDDYREYIEQCEREGLPESERKSRGEYFDFMEEYSSDYDYVPRRTDWKPKEYQLIPPLCRVLTIPAAKVLLDAGADPFETVLTFEYCKVCGSSMLCNVVNTSLTAFDYMLDGGRRDVYEFVLRYAEEKILSRKKDVFKLVMLADGRRNGPNPHAIKFRDINTVRLIAAMVGGRDRDEQLRKLAGARDALRRDLENHPDPEYWPVFRNVQTGFTLKIDEGNRHYTQRITLLSLYSNYWFNYCNRTVTIPSYYNDRTEIQRALKRPIRNLEHPFKNSWMYINRGRDYHNSNNGHVCDSECEEYGCHNDERVDNFTVDVGIRQSIGRTGIPWSSVEIQNQVEMVPVRDGRNRVIAYTIEPKGGRDAFVARCRADNFMPDMKCFGRYDLLYEFR